MTDWEKEKVSKDPAIAFTVGFREGRNSFKEDIKEKMKTLKEKHNDFRDMTVFNVPREVESDFIKYMIYKELIEND
jgi:hypothetical protein